jgi:esterase
MKLFYREYGEGPALIILHGLYGSSDNWVHIARKLQQSFKVILPDMRNHGRSPWSDTHNYSVMSEDVSELFTELGLTKAFIAGHSMGGKTAAKFVTDHPEKVSGLLIGDISPFAYTSNSQIHEQHRNVLGVMNSVDLATFATRNEAESYLSSIVGEKTTKLVFSKNILTENGKLRWKLNVKSLAANIENLSAGIPTVAMGGKKIENIPTIVLKGEQSFYVSDSDLDEIRAIFPGVIIRVARNCGHWIHTDSPEEVVKALKDLLILSNGGKIQVI